MEQIKKKSISKLLVHNLKPMVIGLAIDTAFMIVTVGIFYNPSQYNLANLNTLKSSVEESYMNVGTLSSSKKSLESQKIANKKIIDEKNTSLTKRGLNRTTSTDIPSLIRYIDFRAYDNSLTLIKTEMNPVGGISTVDCVLTGAYNDILNFFDSLNTQEYIYINTIDMKTLRDGKIQVMTKLSLTPLKLKPDAKAKSTTTPPAGTTQQTQTNAQTSSTQTNAQTNAQPTSPASTTPQAPTVTK